ncbi:MAG: hypothetical protein Q4A42_02905 [Tissierellia bacterium]|nr:hypothetical protein [Tissierellia bacterium]
MESLYYFDRKKQLERILFWKEIELSKVEKTGDVATINSITTDIKRINEEIQMINQAKEDIKNE